MFSKDFAFRRDGTLYCVACLSIPEPDHERATLVCRCGRVFRECDIAEERGKKDCASRSGCGSQG